MKPTYREKNLLDYLFGGFRSTLNKESIAPFQRSDVSVFADLFWSLRLGRWTCKLRNMLENQGGAASCGGGAVDGGFVNAFLAAALTRVMRAAVPIPTVASASVLHSAVVDGSVTGVVGPL